MAAPLLTDDDRELLRQLMEALDDADLEAQANVRAYRNIHKRANDLIGAARDQNDPQRPVTGTAGATPVPEPR
jgi:hypothetical protein